MPRRRLTSQCDQNHAAKVRQFSHSHNRTFVAFCIPLTWYTIYHSYGIVATKKSPYLCRRIQTQTIMAKIYVNGDAQEVSLPLNVSELIQQQNVLQPEMVSVQVNEEFAEREDWESIQLKEGDKVDFLYFMGGGQAL